MAEGMGAPHVVSESEQPSNRLARHLVTAGAACRVAALTVVLGVVVTWWARHALGPAPTAAEVERWGFGLPPILDGRWWALATGSLMTSALTVPIPIFTLIGVIVYERLAGFWRTAVVLFGGQLFGIVVVSLFLWPWRGGPWPRGDELSYAVDFGISIGGFACLGAATAYLPSPWRRWLRVGITCYFPGQLVLSCFLYDLMHPMGWIVGVALGARLWSGPVRDGSSATSRYDGAITVGFAALGAVAGIAFGQLGGGPGMFG